MLKVKPVIVAALAAALVLSACANNSNGMMNLRASGFGPDEFAILPTKPLEAPKSYAELPQPTPGGTNLADPTPRLDAAAILGGSRKSMTRAGIPRTDQGIISIASRYGVSADIRAILAAEDAEFRSKHRGKLLDRLFANTVYFSAYQEQALDRYGELKRLRRLGVGTPAAPPEPKQ